MAFKQRSGARGQGAGERGSPSMLRRPGARGGGPTFGVMRLWLAGSRLPARATSKSQATVVGHAGSADLTRGQSWPWGDAFARREARRKLKIAARLRKGMLLTPCAGSASTYRSAQRHHETPADLQEIPRKTQISLS